MKRVRGFTYAEVMVAALILALLTGIGIILLQFAKRAQAHTETDTQAFRQGSQAVARLRRELRGCKILDPANPLEEATQLHYRYPKLEGGNLVVDAYGMKEWEGEARLYQQGSKLMLEKPLGGPVQLLADLQDGQFKVQVDPTYYWFLIEVKRPGESAPAFSRTFRLSRLGND